MREVVREAARFPAAGPAAPMRLGDVADHVGYSPFHLARACRATVPASKQLLG
ncbi:helix-turn-helix transcriptional regulator [Amycolatopsis panacis]|uniref:AraC family transcriptional regulator n=1 Tax=Amycolatopsis panacis TaxID=2340917 RepID=A0A419I434_9PSEU|nr:helix-turn-helix transcriptional regulator [Amycolatopsis panacis]RJQ85077.1 AraC family transcriptional regulator [Amycolatopsis panacis]